MNLEFRLIKCEVELNNNKVIGKEEIQKFSCNNIKDVYSEEEKEKLAAVLKLRAEKHTAKAANKAAMNCINFGDEIPDGKDYVFVGVWKNKDTGKILYKTGKKERDALRDNIVLGEDISFTDKGVDYESRKMTIVTNRTVGDTRTMLLHSPENRKFFVIDQTVDKKERKVDMQIKEADDEDVIDYLRRISPSLAVFTSMLKQLELEPSKITKENATEIDFDNLDTDEVSL